MMQMIQSRRQLALLAGAALLSSLAVRGGEQVQIRGSTDIVLPKPTRTFEDSRKYKIDREEHSDIEGGFIAPPAPEGSALMDKRARELLDKKKNWIFMNPYEPQYDSKTAEFMKGEKSTGL